MKIIYFFNIDRDLFFKLIFLQKTNFIKNKIIVKKINRANITEPV